MKIIITQKDAENGFKDCNNCALATAIKRTLGKQLVAVGSHTVNEIIGEHSKLIGYINPAFHKSDFDKLKSGEIKEFITEYVNNKQTIIWKYGMQKYRG